MPTSQKTASKSGAKAKTASSKTRTGASSKTTYSKPATPPGKYFLIIAEKPDVAREIAAVLGKNRWQKGYIQGDTFICSFAVGHILEYAEPHEYDPAYKSYSFTHLPIVPEKFKLKVIPNKKEQFSILKTLLNDPNVYEVVNACDSGREGELIFDRIYKSSKCTKPVKRLWLTENTPEAIKNAFANLLDGAAKENLRKEAESRAKADWILGMNASRAFTLIYGESLPQGRVLTPTLCLIVQREEEIRKFVPKTYFEIFGQFRTGKGELFNAQWFRDDVSQLASEREVNSILAGLPGSGQVLSVDVVPKKTAPPMLFDLSDLQRECNKRFGLTAKNTLTIAQALYEKHKAITYPRTSSKHLSTTLEDTLKDRLRALKGINDYAGLIPVSIKKLGKRFVDDSQLTDHHAIIPQLKAPNVSHLSPDERKVYDLVVRRFLAMFYPDYEYTETIVVVQCGKETFRTKGIVENVAGWKAVYRDEDGKGKRGKQKVGDGQDEQESGLPKLQVGQVVEKVKAWSKKEETKPPARYNDSTLLSAMKFAGRLVEDEELAQKLKEVKGIGTEATRAQVIERLIEIGYVVRKGKEFIPTPKGEDCIRIAPEQLKSVVLTAEWERGLGEIEQGKRDPKGWLAGIIGLTGDIVEQAKQVGRGSSRGSNGEKDGAASGTNKYLGCCPACKKGDIREVKSGKGWGCSNFSGGCQFFVAKTIAGRTIPPEEVVRLIETKQTLKMDGFVSGRTGNLFSAMLVVGEGGKVEFSFE